MGRTRSKPRIYFGWQEDDLAGAKATVRYLPLPRPSQNSDGVKRHNARKLLRSEHRRNGYARVRMCVQSETVYFGDVVRTLLPRESASR